MIFGISIKSFVVGVVMMVVLSIPIGYVGSSLIDYYIRLQGASFSGSNATEVYRVMSAYKYHPWMILYYLLNAMVGVALPSFVAGYVSKKNHLTNAMAIGVVAVMLFLITSDAFQDMMFSLFFVILTLIASLAGGYVSRYRYLRYY